MRLRLGGQPPRSALHDPAELARACTGSGCPVAAVSALSLPLLVSALQARLLFGFVDAGNPYPTMAGSVSSTAKNGSTVQVPCTAEKIFLTTDDLEQIFWHSSFPVGYAPASLS